MTTETIVVDDVEYVWYNYTEPIRYLSANDINNINSNFKVLGEILINKGYTFINYAPNNTHYNNGESFNLVTIALNSVESNIEWLRLVKNIGNRLTSIYYKEKKTAKPGTLAHNTEEIWRWFQIANDLLEIVSGEKGVHTYLKCKDGYPTINGKVLRLRGEKI